MEQSLLEKVAALIEYLRLDPLYRQLSSSHAALLCNEAVRGLIQQLAIVKTQRDNHSGRHGRYCEKATISTLHKAKLALDSHPAVRRHKAIESAFQDKLDAIGKSLAYAVSMHIPYGRFPHKPGGSTCSKEKV